MAGILISIECITKAAEAEEAASKTNRGKNSPRKSRALAAKRPRKR